MVCFCESFISICRLTWVLQEEFIGKEIARIRQICGTKGRVIGAVSGGVDSTVAAKLMQEAIGDRYVDKTFNSRRSHTLY